MSCNLGQICVAGQDVMKILVVEDNLMISLDICFFLEDSGHEIVGPAHSLSEAVSLASKASFDLALLDIDLGDEEVWNAANIIQDAGIPLAFVSGRIPGDRTPDRFVSSTYIPKPFCRETVQKFIQSVT